MAGTTRRARARLPRLVRAVAAALAVGTAVVSGLRAPGAVRFRVAAEGSPETTATLGGILADMVAGGDLWSPWARWLGLAVLAIALLLIGTALTAASLVVAVSYRARRPRVPATVGAGGYRPPDRAASHRLADTGCAGGTVGSVALAAPRRRTVMRVP